MEKNHLDELRHLAQSWTKITGTERINGQHQTIDSEPKGGLVFLNSALVKSKASEGDLYDIMAVLRFGRNGVTNGFPLVGAYENVHTFVEGGMMLVEKGHPYDAQFQSNEFPMPDSLQPVPQEVYNPGDVVVYSRGSTARYVGGIGTQVRIFSFGDILLDPFPKERILAMDRRNLSKPGIDYAIRLMITNENERKELGLTPLLLGDRDMPTLLR